MLSMNRLIAAAAVVLIPALLQSQSAPKPLTQSPRPQADVVFCQYEISRDLIRAYASFNVAYTFEVNGDGKVGKVKPALHDNWVEQTQVEKCLSAWRFIAIPAGTKGSVVFRWEHAKGWVWMDVSLPQFSQRVAIEGNRCPYSGCDTKDETR